MFLQGGNPMKKSLVVLALAAGLVTAPATVADEPKATVVRIGLTDTLFRDNPEARSEKAARPFKSLLEQQTGLTGDVVIDLKPDDLAQQLKDGKVQVAVFQGFEYAWARQKDRDLKPLMIAVNQKPQLRAMIAVRNDSGAAGLADLKGKTVAVPRRIRAHCQLFLDRRCDALGKPTKDFFAKVQTPTTPEEAIEAVVNGRADAALTDGIFLDWYEKNKPTRYARLKVVEKSPAFPATVVAYRAGALDDATRDRLRKGMLSAKDNPRGVELMELCQMTSFEPVPDDYDKLLTEIAKAYPAPEKAKEKKKEAP
jgi:ABC-type phosphate/phosphonate transport system substrate-binding protein